MNEDKANELLEEYKTELSEDYSISQDQREAANEDMRFCNVDGGMWEDFLEKTYTDRAKLEFDITSDYVMRFVGEWTMNRANVTFIPDDDNTSDDDAEMISGIYRDDFRSNDGKVSQDNAVLELAQCGMGSWRISTAEEDDEEIDDDRQKAIFEPIYESFNNVIWDSNAKRSDKADAKHCTLLTSYTKEAYEREFPEHDKINAYTPTTSFNWIDDGLIYVAERYEVKKKKETVCIYQNEELEKIERYLKTDTESIESRENDPQWTKVREKKILSRYVEKSIFNGAEFIQEPKRIAGKFIPIISIYAYRTFVNGVEHYYGLIRKRKDANRLFNMNVSKMAEAGASSGDTVPILTRDQVDGLENIWADRVNKAYMLINDLEDAEGNKVASAPVGYLQPNQVDPNTIATTEIITNFMQRLNGNAPQDSIDPTASGVAIEKLRNRDNLNTQVVSDNILTSITHSGNVWLSIAKEIYNESRSKALLSEDGTVSRIQLHEMVMDKKKGELIEINDISKGKFKVYSETAPMYQSQQEATIRSIEAVIDKVGENSAYFTPLMAMWMENISGTGLKPLKEFNRKQMLQLKLIEPETPEEEQLLQELAQQVDPDQELVKAAANQQNAEAENLKASSVQKIADANYKNVQAAEKVVDIGIKRTEQTLQRLTQQSQSL